MHLLKDGVPFIWDEISQASFEPLKKALISTSLLSPPDYMKYFMLYLDESESTIGVVLFQSFRVKILMTIKMTHSLMRTFF